MNAFDRAASAVLDFDMLLPEDRDRDAPGSSPQGERRRLRGNRKAAGGSCAARFYWRTSSRFSLR